MVKFTVDLIEYEGHENKNFINLMVSDAITSDLSPCGVVKLQQIGNRASLIKSKSIPNLGDRETDQLV